MAYSRLAHHAQGLAFFSASATFALRRISHTESGLEIGVNLMTVAAPLAYSERIKN